MVILVLVCGVIILICFLLCFPQHWTIFYSLLRPFIFQLESEKAHDLFTFIGLILSKLKFPSFIIRFICGRKFKTLQTEFLDTILPSPVGLAAGFDYNAKMPRVIQALGFGFESVGTITYSPCSVKNLFFFWVF